MSNSWWDHGIEIDSVAKIKCQSVHNYISRGYSFWGYILAKVHTI